MPTWTITLIYPRYRSLKKFVETKTSLCLGGLLVKISVWDTSCFLIKSKFGKTVEYSKSIEHSQKRNWLFMPRHSMLDIQKWLKAKMLNVLKRIEYLCQGTACWIFNGVEHSWKTKFVEHSMKESKIEPHQRPLCAALPKWFLGIFLIWNEQSTWSAW